MIFPILDSDKIIQVGDKVRLDFKKTFKTPGEEAITSVKIKPSVADSFYTVASLANAEVPDYYYLDWVYESAGTKVVEV